MSKIFIYISIVYLTLLSSVGIIQISKWIGTWWMPLVIGIPAALAVGKIQAYVESSTPDTKQGKVKQYHGSY